MSGLVNISHYVCKVYKLMIIEVFVPFSTVIVVLGFL